MGCGASNAQPAKGEEKGKGYKADDPAEKPKAAPQPKDEPKAAAPSNGTDAATSPTPAPAAAEAAEAEAPTLPHRGKHMPFPGMREVNDGTSAYYVVCYPHLGDYRGTCFACTKLPAADESVVAVARFTDAELTKVKEERQIKLQWGSFWKALNLAFGKGENTVLVVDGGKRLEISLKSSKDPKPTPFHVDLTVTEVGTKALYEHFVLPGCAAYKQRKERAEEAAEGDDEKAKGKGAKEEEHARREAMINLHEAVTKVSNKLAAGLSPLVEPLRKESKEAQGLSSEAQKKLDSCRRRINALQHGGKQCHPLDGIYHRGGPRPFTHVPFAKPHEPRETEADPAVVEMIKAGFPRPENENAEDFTAAMTSALMDPTLKAAVEGLPSDAAGKVFQCYGSLDRWDYDCFALDEASGGDSLFATGFALCHKYGLVKHFGIDQTILMNFWTGCQAGYHPNPYHNSNHAADVLQITHFILGPGGMAQVLRLSKEDLLAALVAAGIHDYDHPGFNNNFHTRTGGYLSTLYNDRSVLENHHCACIFEMMRHPRYDVFGCLNDDQRKEVRDTLVEMLLSTDMGNHAKIFSQFRRRLAEGPDWHARKDDIRLALVMAIKMADISNCGRPLFLYKKWAEAIANEFYIQGDSELQMRMMVSPFMDRRKHQTDFPKGQISFINYIVSPLFEVMVELLPGLDFTVKHCQDNKEYWQAGNLPAPTSG